MIGNDLQKSFHLIAMLLEKHTTVTIERDNRQYKAHHIKVHAANYHDTKAEMRCF